MRRLYDGKVLVFSTNIMASCTEHADPCVFYFLHSCVFSRLESIPSFTPSYIRFSRDIFVSVNMPMTSYCSSPNGLVLLCLYSRIGSKPLSSGYKEDIAMRTLPLIRPQHEESEVIPLFNDSYFLRIGLLDWILCSGEPQLQAAVSSVCPFLELSGEFRARKMKTF